MSQMIRTQNGLNYTISDEVYHDMEIASETFVNADVWGSTNLLIEAAANLPTFTGWLTFVILSFVAPIQWYMVIAYAAVANLCGYAIQYQLWLLKNPIVLTIISFFNWLTFKKIDWIALLAISIWQLHHWGAAPIYIAVDFAIMALLIGKHESREYFNNSAAKLVIKLLTEQSSTT